MNKTQTISTTASDPTVAAAAAQFLSPVVLGLQALTVNGKQAHWHVRGANFVGVHELLDTIVDARGRLGRHRRGAHRRPRPADRRARADGGGQGEAHGGPGRLHAGRTSSSAT